MKEMFPFRFVRCRRIYSFALIVLPKTVVFRQKMPSIDVSLIRFEEEGTKIP